MNPVSGVACLSRILMTLCNIVNIGKISDHITSIKNLNGTILSIASANKNNAISGRPHGPYTVKNRNPVVGSEKDGCECVPLAH